MSGENQFERRVQRAAIYHQHYLEVVRQMMFVNGDSEEPLESCKDFVLNIVKYQLVKLLNDAYEYTKVSKRKQIDVKDLVFMFRRHKNILGRLIKFAQTASSIRQLNSFEQQSNIGVKDGGDSSDDQDELKYAAKRLPVSHYGMIADAIDLLDGDFTSKELEVDFPDHVLDARQRRIAARVSILDSSQYSRFSDARKATFQPPVKKGSKRDSEDLLVWLGSPPVVRGIEFIMGFLAREIVAQLVYDALTIREQEPPGWFANGGSPGCIQMRHYEEAVRRNMGFRHRGDYLFGYF